jgi:hypothetical protein
MQFVIQVHSRWTKIGQNSNLEILGASMQQGPSEAVKITYQKGFYLGKVWDGALLSSSHSGAVVIRE